MRKTSKVQMRRRMILMIAATEITETTIKMRRRRTDAILWPRRNLG